MPAHFRGIDGLRALAILGVIAFHTRPSLLQGGFIGVTMFFVITGFLATRSVLNMVDRTGSFGYGRYLIRRITRLWPVMLATIAVVPWLTWMFAPSLLQKVVSDSLPSALFASNWVYIFRKVPYFEAAGLPSPLTHLWFLGVTMQFYLVWPLLMVVLGKITKSKWVRSMAILVIMAASTADMVLLFDPANTSRVYYGTDTRLAELAAVVVLAASEAFYQLVEAARKSVQMPRSQHAKPLPKAGYRLRPGAWVMSVIGLVTVVALTWAPVDWNGIAQARAIQLRPELAAPAKPVKKPAKPEPESSAINAANGETNTADANKNGSDSQPPIIKPIAEKVPNNLDISKYAYDPATESCNADMMMVGDSVTSGTSDAIQAAFPNAFIDGLPNRQLPQAVDVYQQDTAAGHSGSVVVFGLGTNGVISNEQEVQQLIDLTGGKPTYFITIRMPYPWQENNNNTMLREAAKKNKNVGIIDWHGYSEGHSEYLNDDGIHPNMTGAYAYATMIRQAVCGQ